MSRTGNLLDAVAAELNAVVWGEPVTIAKAYLPEVDRTELAEEIQKLGLAYQAWDFTAADAEHARRKELIAERLRPQFEAEGNLFLYENHLGEALGVQRACNASAHGRYLYIATII